VFSGSTLPGACIFCGPTLGAALFLDYLNGSSRFSWNAGLFGEGGVLVSIVRVGLAETKNFAEGYEAIFGKKDSEKATKKSRARKAKARAKKPAKKSKGR
jgi:hypothetical protein